MAAWCDITETWTQDPAILTEILKSFYYRGLFGLSDPLEEDVNGKSIVSEGSPVMQDFRCWRDLQKRLTGLEPTGPSPDAFFEAKNASGANMGLRPYVRDYFVKVENDVKTGTYRMGTLDSPTVTELFEDAGVTNGGFRRATSYDPDVNDWTNRNDPMYSNGYASSGDILGPWLVEDIRAVLGILNYIECMPSSKPTLFGEALQGLDFDLARTTSASGFVTLTPAGREDVWPESGLPEEEVWEELEDLVAQDYAEGTGLWFNFDRDQRTRMFMTSDWTGNYDGSNPNWSEIYSISGGVRVYRLKMYKKESDSLLDAWPFPTDIENIEYVIVLGDESATGEPEPIVVPVNGTAADVSAEYTIQTVPPIPVPLNIPREPWLGGIEDTRIEWEAIMGLIMKIDAPYEE